jgi:hypothetical protein
LSGRGFPARAISRSDGNDIVGCSLILREWILLEGWRVFGAVETTLTLYMGLGV